jgi:5-methylcytosine-specific restriction endonuclease McrA
MVKRIYKSELDVLADLHGRIAVHAKALAGLEQEITNRIERSDLFTVLVADTAIAENYSDPAKCLAWLTASHRSWLRANASFNQMAERQVFYRYVLLPYPSIVRNLAKRQLLADIILLHLHLHLWHGVICGVVFLDPRKTELANILEDLNFVAIPSQRVFLDTPAFYRGESLRTSVLTDARANRRLEDAHRVLFAGGRGRPIWLHYDEANFSRERLQGWRWDVFRAFFRNLYGPSLKCSLCGNLIGAFELDHIAPVSRGFYQTLINFRPLCAKCNREKSDIVGENPFQLKLLLSEELGTRELDDIHRLPPPWLGTVDGPSSARQIEARLKGRS